MNLVLVGFMASGKTAVGRRLARRLGYGFLDTDHWLEREMGCTIAEVFEQKGEPYFRKLEAALAASLHKLENHVISTGGGIVTTPDNIESLQRAGMVVFLNADPEEIIGRLEHDTHRPKLKEGDLRETVTRLLGERMPLYLRAGVAVDTKGKSANRVAGEVIHLVVERREKEATQAGGEPTGEGTPEGAPTEGGGEGNPKPD